jgi:hypothetical protein
MLDDCNLLLGEDDKVHTGEVVRKMSATLMQTDCGTPALRPIGPREIWWAEDWSRPCPSCMQEILDHG